MTCQSQFRLRSSRKQKQPVRFQDMSDVVATVEKQLLQARGMSLGDIEQSIGTLLGRERLREVFVQSTRGESFGLEDGIVKDGSFGVEAGIGVRGLAGEKTGFAYSEDIRLDGLREAAKAAKSIAGQVLLAGCLLKSERTRRYTLQRTQSAV